MSSHITVPLPVEIWDAILMCACTPERAPRVGRLQTHTVPITVSHVCRYWRNFAIANPTFWTDISYVFSYVAYSPRPRPELMHLFLERSSDLPLTVNLDIEEHSGESCPEAHDLLIDLFTNLKRWRSATLFIAYDQIDGDLWDDLGPLVANGAPLLESLEVTVQGDEESMDVFPQFLWTGAPKLTKFAIELDEVKSDEYLEREYYGEEDDEDEEGNGVKISNWALTNKIPYKQLTHLMIEPGPNGDITWREASAIFSVAQNLVSCSLHGLNGSRDIPRTSTRRTTLQHLRYLDLTGPYDVDGNTNGTLLPALNRILTAPSLRALSLLHTDDTWNKEAYADFINRSACPLTDLHFALSPHNRHDHLLECIALTPPSLRSLHLNHLGFLIPEFSERMGEWDKETGRFKLCPLLQQLAIDLSVYVGSFPDPLNHMVDMLKKRVRPPGGLPTSFKKLVVSPWIRSQAATLNDLVDEPYSLCIETGNVFSKVLPEARAVFNMGLS